MAASMLILNPSPVEDFGASSSRHGFESVAPTDKRIQLFLYKVGEDGWIPIEVIRSDTIASVKMRIQSQRGFLVNQQRLVYGGRELIEDGSLINDYGLKNGEKLHLVLRPSDLVAITVKTVNGEKHVFQVHRTERVRDLKKCISNRSGGLLPEQQLLTLRGEEIEDRIIIQDLFLGGDAILHLSAQNPAKVRERIVGRHLELGITAAEPLKREAAAVSVENLFSKGAGEVIFSDPVNNSRIEPHVNNVKKEEQFRHPNTVQESVCHHSSLEPARYSLRFEIPDALRDLVEQVRTGLNAGCAPILASEGSGGVYFMRDECGLENVAVFKPADEEPMAINNPRGFSSSYGRGEGLKRGTITGEGAIREVAAYLLDHPVSGLRSWKGNDQEGFAGVPPTMMARCYHEAFNYNSVNRKLYRKAKVGSLQQFVDALSSCEDMGPSSFPVEEVHKVAVLDLRLANADRNGGNILVCKRENRPLKLVPIDHGYCLPEKFEDCTFEWLYWPQALEPFGSSTLKYIASLDAELDIALLRQHGWNLRPQTARVLSVSTMLLKKGAAAGLTPFQIGSIMSRSESLDTKSPIELMLEEAEGCKPPYSTEGEFLRNLSRLLDEYITTLKFL